MSPLTWTGRQLAVFWLASLAASALLLGAGALTWPREWRSSFWLFPYPSSPAVVWRLVRAAFAARPLEATALLAVPAVALAVTAAWAAARLLRR